MVHKWQPYNKSMLKTKKISDIIKKILDGIKICSLTF